MEAHLWLPVPGGHAALCLIADLCRQAGRRIAIDPAEIVGPAIAPCLACQDLALHALAARAQEIAFSEVSHG